MIEAKSTIPERNHTASSVVRVEDGVKRRAYQGVPSRSNSKARQLQEEEGQGALVQVCRTPSDFQSLGERAKDGADNRFMCNGSREKKQQSFKGQRETLRRRNAESE